MGIILEEFAGRQPEDGPGQSTAAELAAAVGSRCPRCLHVLTATDAIVVESHYRTPDQRRVVHSRCHEQRVQV